MLQDKKKASKNEYHHAINLGAGKEARPADMNKPMQPSLVTLEQKISSIHEHQRNSAELLSACMHLLEMASDELFGPAPRAGGGMEKGLTASAPEGVLPRLDDSLQSAVDFSAFISERQMRLADELKEFIIRIGAGAVLQAVPGTSKAYKSD
jgi:hypothetical protein